MKPNQKSMIATLIKEGRMAKGLTQKELSELSNVSVRSIQRIENQELIPRSFTLKALASSLELSFESFQEEELERVPELVHSSKSRTAQKIILSAGLSLTMILLAASFLAQAPHFPETHFELFNFSLAVVAIITVALLLIWKK